MSGTKSQHLSTSADVSDQLKVVRYHINAMGGMEGIKTGNWVPYSDYEALADRLSGCEDVLRQTNEDRDKLVRVRKSLMRESRKLAARVEELEEWKQGVEEAHWKVMEERCPKDEVHCTCVPALRAENKRLREETDGYFKGSYMICLDANRALRSENEHFESENTQLLAENKRLRGALEEIIGITKYGRIAAIDMPDIKNAARAALQEPTE